jgi:hypothetical protein
MIRARAQTLDRRGAQADRVAPARCMRPTPRSPPDEYKKHPHDPPDRVRTRRAHTTVRTRRAHTTVRPCAHTTARTRLRTHDAHTRRRTRRAHKVGRSERVCAHDTNTRRSGGGCPGLVKVVLALRVHDRWCPGGWSHTACGHHPVSLSAPAVSVCALALNILARPNGRNYSPVKLDLKKLTEIFLNYYWKSRRKSGFREAFHIPSTAVINNNKTPPPTRTAL